MTLCYLSAGVAAVSYANVGQVLSLACEAGSSSGSFFRWILLFESAEEVSEDASVILREAECAYKAMGLAHIGSWNFLHEIPSTDYKVIAIGLPVAALRKSLKLHVS